MNPTWLTTLGKQSGHGFSEVDAEPDWQTTPPAPPRPYLVPSASRKESGWWNYAIAALLISIALYFAGRIGGAFVSGAAGRALTRQDRALQRCATIHDHLLRGQCIAEAEQEGDR